MMDDDAFGAAVAAAGADVAEQQLEAAKMEAAEAQEDVVTTRDLACLKNLNNQQHLASTTSSAQSSENMMVAVEDEPRRQQNAQLELLNRKLYSDQIKCKLTLFKFTRFWCFPRNIFISYSATKKLIIIR